MGTTIGMAITVELSQLYLNARFHYTFDMCQSVEIELAHNRSRLPVLYCE